MTELPKINSRDNQKLKFTRAVRDGREPEFIFVEGMRLAEEAVKAALSIKFAFVTPSFRGKSQSARLVANLSGLTGEIYELDESIFSSISDTKTSQGVILIASRPATGEILISGRLSPVPIVLLLHKLNNPSNLGAILRTAEAAGVDAVISTKGSTDVFSSKALRGGMGANLRLAFWTDTEFLEAIEWARRKGLRSVCADVRSSKSYIEIDWTVPRLLIVGSEGHGLTERERELTDENLIIPMLNDVESLNVAVACGIILFEAKKQKEGK